MSLKPPKTNQPQSILSSAELMPQNKEAERILRSRAKQMAIQPIDTQKAFGTTSYIRFRLGTDELYGIPYHFAKEVMRHLTPTTVPFAPYYIAGVINRRGALLSVLDLKKMFHIPLSENTHIILVSSGKITVGILTDGIEGIDNYDLATLDAPLPTAGTIKPDYILGLDKGITAIINVEALLADIQLKVAT